MSDALRIAATDRKGRAAALECRPTGTLMEALKAMGLPVAATCGGAKSCATCHVYVNEGYDRVGAPDEDETDLLSESDHYRDGVSRLSCQIELHPGLSDLQVVLAPADR
jgi:2Fe-2S ferredoxin